MKKLVALLAVLSMVGAASAGLTVSGNTYGEATGETYDFDGTIYNQFIISLAAPEAMSAIDVAVSGADLLQVTNYSRTRTTVVTTNPKKYTYSAWVPSSTLFQTYSGGMAVADTSTLLILADLVPATMEENSNVVAPADWTGAPTTVSNLPLQTSAYGFGTNFRVATGFQPGVDTVTPFEFAQIWIPDGQVATVTGAYVFASDAQGTKIPVSFTVGAIPEPATIGLLAMGVLGLLRRKHA